MKRTLMRRISLLLVFVLFLGLFPPVYASASSADDTTSVTVGAEILDPAPEQIQSDISDP